MPQPSQTTTDQLKRITGESRTIVEFLLSFASKRLAAAAWGAWKFSEIGLATMESDAIYARWLFGYSAACIVAYIVSEMWVKGKALDVWARRAYSTEIAAQVDRVSETATTAPPSG